METSRSLEKHEEALRRTLAEEPLRERLTALAVVREYFLEHAEIRAVEALRPEDARDFAVDWLIRSGEADAESARAALAALEGWVGSFAGELPAERRRELGSLLKELRRDVPRVLRAADLLARRTPGEPIAGSAAVVDEEDEETPTGSVTAGLDRTVDLEQLDYGRAEQEEFVLERLEGDEATLRANLPGAASPPQFGPVRLPPGAAAALRPGDILNVEIAPAEAHWEIVDVLAVYPAGHAPGH